MTPIIVWPRVSKVIVVTRAMPGAARRTPSMAALISLRSDIVSIQMRSTPPATSDAACSRKTSTASSYSSVPSGATISPLGPMSPATSAVPAGGVGPRRGARMAAVRLSSSTRSRRPCRRKPQPVAAERVGQQDARAGVEVAALDAPDDVRVGQVPDLGRIAELEAGREQHRAHRAVGEDRAALVEHGAEAGAGSAAVDGQTGGAVGERDRVDLDGRAGLGGAVTGGRARTVGSAASHGRSMIAAGRPAPDRASSREA